MLLYLQRRHVVQQAFGREHSGITARELPQKHFSRRQRTADNLHAVIFQVDVTCGCSDHIFQSAQLIDQA